MNLLIRFTPEFVLLVYIALFVGFKHPSQEWDRIINSDGKGYYAYLPALCIYQDPQYAFVEQYETLYYPSDKVAFKEFRMPAGEVVINKYTPGLAVIWTPFFLSAHAITSFTALPADGYSAIYQYAIAFASLLLLWAGLRFLLYLLFLLHFTGGIGAFVVWIIALGTNLPFFVVIEPSMTHVYSFTLITLFLISGLRFVETRKHKWLILGTMVYVLVILIRPTNALIFLLLPFMAGSWERFRDTLTYLWNRKTWMVQTGAILLTGALFWMMVSYIQTGRLLQYTYGSETFRFLDPHPAGLVCSFNRGWFLYTPIALLSFAGLIRLYRSSPLRAGSILLFFLVMIYVLSSWWMWYFASKCGQRVFIDFLALTGLLIAALLQTIRATWWKTLTGGLLTILLIFNLFQLYQHFRWVFPATYITSEIYQEVFFRVRPEAKAWLPSDAISDSVQFTHSMNKPKGWMNEYTLLTPDTAVLSENKASCIDQDAPYSVGMEWQPYTFYTTTNRMIMVSAHLNSSEPNCKSSLVIDLSGPEGYRCYRQFFFSDYLRPNTWTLIEKAFYLPENLHPETTVKIYFLHQELGQPLWIDDLKITMVSLKEEERFKNMDGYSIHCQ